MRPPRDCSNQASLVGEELHDLAFHLVLVFSRVVAWAQSRCHVFGTAVVFVGSNQGCRNRRGDFCHSGCGVQRAGASAPLNELGAVNELAGCFTLHLPWHLL